MSGIGALQSQVLRVNAFPVGPRTIPINAATEPCLIAEFGTKPNQGCASTICLPALTHALPGAVKASLARAYVFGGHGSFGMSPCSTIAILCHRLTDLLTLRLGLSVGGCD
jgi:hypothetical protein